MGGGLRIPSQAVDGVVQDATSGGVDFGSIGTAVPAKFLTLLIGAAVLVGLVALIICLIVGAKKKTEETNSVFEGSYWAYIGISLLTGLASCASFGIAFPWMFCWLLRYLASNTKIGGKKLVFDGTGGQLIGRYILWCFLSIITFGIYSFWFVVNVLKWIVKHTHFEGEEGESKFDGGGFGWFGTLLLAGLITVITCGIGYAAALKIILKWIVKHTSINGTRLKFVGTGVKLFVKLFAWTALTIITFGIYGWFVPVKQIRWVVENTAIE